MRTAPSRRLAAPLLLLLLTGFSTAANPGDDAGRAAAQATAATSQAAPASTPPPDPAELAAHTAEALSEAATRLSSAAQIDGRFLGQALAKLDAALATPNREKVDLLLADEEETVRGFRALADGLVDLARSHMRLGGEVTAAQKALDEARAGSARRLQQILDSRAPLDRVIEDRRLALLESDGARQRVVAAQAFADRALAAHRKAHAEAAALSSPLGQLGSLLKRALTASVPGSQPGADWIAAHIDRRRKALEEFRIALLQERESRAKLELDVAYRSLDRAKLELEQRDASARGLDDALERLRKQLGVTVDEVRKTEAAAKQAQAEAQLSKAASAKTAEQAREEKDAAVTAEARLKQRRQELEKERAAQPEGTDSFRLEARGQALDAEAHWAEDRRLLAGEREQLSLLEADLGRAKERLATEQSTAMRRIFEAVHEALADPDRTVPIELQYRAARAGLDSTEQETRSISAATDSVRSARAAIVKRLALLAERVAKEKAAAADETRGALLKSLQEDQRTMLERQKVADATLDIYSGLLKVLEDRAKFFADAVGTLSHYRRESETKVTTVSLMEGYQALQDTTDRLAARAAAAPGELQFYASRPENRLKIASGTGIVALLLLAASGLYLALLRTGRRLHESPSPAVRSAVELALETLGPLLFFAAAGLSVQILGAGDRQLRATLADPFLYWAAFRVLRWPLRHWAARLSTSKEPRWCFVCAAMSWTVWILRYALVFAILEHGIAHLGASRTLQFLASAARNVGILGLVLAFLTFERTPLAKAVQLEPSGEFPQLRHWYNQAVLRIYTGILIFLAIVGGLWLAGYRDRAEWLFQSTLLTVAILIAGTAAQWGAVSWLRRAVSPDAAALPPWWRGWVETAIRLLLGALATLLVLDTWSVEVRFLYAILLSPIVRDAAARIATVLLIALAARFSVEALRFLIYRIFAIGTVVGGGEPLLSRRGLTLAPLLTSVVRYSVYFIASVFALRTVGLDPTPLVAGAGVVGLAVGFGAQSLVKDVITGFFIITEDLISVGDAVEIDGRSGTVEEITVRVTKLRLFSGELRIVPNSEIRQIGNRSRGFMRAIVPIALRPDCDLDAAMRILSDATSDYWEKNREQMFSEPEIQGVLEMGHEQLMLRAVVKVRPSAVADVEHGLRLVIQRSLAEHGFRPYGRKHGPPKGATDAAKASIAKTPTPPAPASEDEGRE